MMTVGGPRWRNRVASGRVDEAGGMTHRIHEAPETIRECWQRSGRRARSVSDDDDDRIVYGRE